jgi:hypothetical protein
MRPCSRTHSVSSEARQWLGVIVTNFTTRVFDQDIAERERPTPGDYQNLDALHYPTFRLSYAPTVIDHVTVR